MKKINLSEDICLGQNLNYETELAKYKARGYIVLSSGTHPAIGKHCVLGIEVPPGAFFRDQNNEIVQSSKVFLWKSNN